MAYSHLLNSLFRHPDDTLYDAVEGHLKSGQDPNAASEYGETPLKQAYRRGRMDVFSLLLDHGADISAMRWGPLHQAVALGNLNELRAAAGDEDKSARDVLWLTPFLLACEMGEVEKAAILLPVSKPEDLYSAYQRQPALAVAASAGRVEVVDWLLTSRFEVDEPDEFGGTALIAAAAAGKVEVVKKLLEAGANIEASYNLSAAVKNIDREGLELAPWPEALDEGSEEFESFRTAASETESAEIARVLIAAGAQPHEFENDVLRELTGAVRIPDQQTTPEIFEAQKSPRFGTTNPEPVDCEFWQDMIRTGMSGYAGQENFGKSERQFDGSAVWSFARFGMSTTQLPDGAWVQIAGEHEDYYDPDFFIYNDVVVHDGAGNAQIYLYPREVFPPTDFHTATLVDDTIILIGSLSYQESRSITRTQVLRLNLKDFSIDQIETTGESPCWISRHHARLDEGKNTVRGGMVWDGDDYIPMNGVFTLSLATGVWETTGQE